MTENILIALSAIVPTLAVFVAALSCLRTRRENDRLREEIEALHARFRAQEMARRECSEATMASEQAHDQPPDQIRT